MSTAYNSKTINDIEMKFSGIEENHKEYTHLV